MFSLKKGSDFANDVDFMYLVFWDQPKNGIIKNDIFFSDAK